VPQQTARSVCVIGAGVAGLCTTKILQRDGFDVVAFDKAPTLGGVWAPQRTYPGLCTNTPRETYAFADFSYPAATSDFPTAPEVRAYLDGYVEHFGFRSRIHLSTEVASVTRRHDPATPRFEVAVRPAGDQGAPAARPFDFVVVCNGVFSRPRVPELPGRDRFAGEVLHSSELAVPGRLRGKRIVVVGGGKSALDCAAVGAREGSACTLAVRAPHWMVPRYFGPFRMDRVVATRFAELLLPPYYHQSRTERLLRRAAAPALRLWWRLQTWLIPRLSRMPAVMVPDEPLPHGLELSGVGSRCYRALRRHELRAERARVVRFSGPETVELDTGEQLAADVVVFATGWRQDVSFLDADLRRAVLRDGRFHLYRQVVPPEEPHLGFVGYASSTECPFTSEIAAHWLSGSFRGSLRLPPAAEMEREVARVARWIHETFPSRDEGFFIGQYVAHYADDLMRDMGLPTRRTRHLATEYFAPFWPERYRGLAAERRARRAA